MLVRKLQSYSMVQKGNNLNKNKTNILCCNFYIFFFIHIVGGYIYKLVVNYLEIVRGLRLLCIEYREYLFKKPLGKRN